jgi:PiT family inorganic phosphate transporter
VRARAPVAHAEDERVLRPVRPSRGERAPGRAPRRPPVPRAPELGDHLGQRIAKIDPPQGFAAQTACASILWGTAHLGFPVSTTQTISDSVLGAGAIRGFSAVRWGVAGNILVAWVLTLPAAALDGAGMEVVTRLPAGQAIVFALTIVIAAGAFAARRWETRKLMPRDAQQAAAPPRSAGTRARLGGVAAASCVEHSVPIQTR